MAEHKLQATFKLGASYDDAWTTVSSDDPAEFFKLVTEFRDQLSTVVADAASVVRATNEAYRAGIVAPSAAVAPLAPTAPAATPSTAPAGPLPASVTITNDGVNAYIEFPFNRDFNAVVKGIGGRFDKVSKRWYVSAAQEAQLRQVAAANFA